ncbi:hypothetical protein NDU88_000418, partial [Pleurodeles waltl]
GAPHRLPNTGCPGQLGVLHSGALVIWGSCSGVPLTDSLAQGALLIWVSCTEPLLKGAPGKGATLGSSCQGMMEECGLLDGALHSGAPHRLPNTGCPGQLGVLHSGALVIWGSCS